MLRQSERQRRRRDVVFQQKSRVKCRTAGRPTAAPLPVLHCCAHLILGEFRRYLSSTAARALLNNSAVACVSAPCANTWGPCRTRGGSLLLLRDKSERKKAQRNTKGFLKSILQDLTHLAELQPLSRINLLHPSDLPASSSQRKEPDPF